MRRLWFLLFLAGVPQMGTAEEPSRDTLQLARVRAHMSHLLQRLPNYTCLQTIERGRRAASGKMELVDVVRLEVALVNGSELFAWPGSKKFVDTPLIDMVKGGAIGNGNFALHAKAVFQSSAPKFTYVGERVREDGVRTLHWDFVVPQARSGYLLRSGPQEATVGYHGSFWAEEATLDLVRLEIVADAIPAALKISNARDTVEYGRVGLGEEVFLLPKNSELVLSDSTGNESRNRVNFARCRRFTGESSISFEDPSPNERKELEKPTLDIPPGLTLEVQLETPITHDASAIGDPITAILKRSVKLGSGLSAPKGAVLHGRITFLRRQNTAGPGWVIGMKFFELEWDTARAKVNADLEDSAVLSLMAGNPTGARAYAYKSILGMNSFISKGSRLSIRRGLPMFWRTKPLEEEDKQ